MEITVIQLINTFVRTQKKPHQILSESLENQALAKGFASAFYFCHANLPSSRETE